MAPPTTNPKVPRRLRTDIGRAHATVPADSSRSSAGTDATDSGISRRTLLAGAVVCLLPAAGMAHTPYRQWVVYRRRHLLIGTDKATQGSYELGKSLAAVLELLLPDSRARVARAPDSRRIASLLASAQLDIALLPRAEALALAEGAGPFSNYGPLELRALYVSAPFVLVCRDDFPEQHAYLVTEALASGFGVDREATFGTGLPVHPGSAEFLADH
jgi:TRAP-type uncharacterized transport system substrate-binding protein